MNYNYNWQQAFDEARAGKRRLLNEHIDKVFNTFLFPFIKAKTHSDNDTSEICSTVLSKFWEKFYVKGDALPNNVNGYLNTMARNALFHFYNMRERQNRTMTYVDEYRLRCIVENDPVDHSKMEGTPSEEKEKLYQAMEAAFEKLGDKCKQLLRMNFFEGKKIKDIKTIMDFPTPNAATQKKVSCFKSLRKLIYLEIQHQKK